MDLKTTLLTLGVILILVGLIGQVKAKEIEVGTKNPLARLVLGLIGFAFVGIALSDNILPYLVPPTSTPSETSLQSAQPNENIFTQNFDNADGSFDTSIFVCPTISCSAQNVFQRNGTLVFKFNASDLSSDVWGAYMKSEVTWKMENLISLEGNLQIGTNTRGGTWLGLNDSSDCSLSVKPDADTPSIRCGLGSNGTTEYSTSDLPAKFDTWYSIRIEYDPLSKEQKYYLDNILIGKHTPQNLPDLAALSLGAWREENQSVNAFIDNIVVRTKP